MLEVYLNAVIALYKELFNIINPACYYTVESQDNVIKEQYRTSLFNLAGAIGLLMHQLNSLLLFLEQLQETFLRTTRQNIPFTYTRIISYRERSNPRIVAHTLRLQVPKIIVR
jgi:hypothetical protein